MKNYVSHLPFTIKWAGWATFTYFMLQIGAATYFSLSAALMSVWP